MTTVPDNLILPAARPLRSTYVGETFALVALLGALGCPLTWAVIAALPLP